MVSVDLNVQPWLRALCLGPKHVGYPLYLGAWHSIFLQKGHQGKLLSSPVPLPSGECEIAAGAVKEHSNLVAPSVASWLASVICLITWNLSVSGFLMAEWSPIQEEQGLMGLSERVGGLEGDFDVPPSLHGTVDHRLLSDLGVPQPQ